MRILILGDIHSNLEAFQAVLRHAESSGGFDHLWCLGDTVGYGPDPGPCIDLLCQYGPLTVAGNHDHAVVGLADVELFTPYAAESCRWTARNLTQEQQTYLRGLPLTLAEGPFTLVHGSLRDPLWEYLVYPEEADATFRLLKTRRCLVSHSHVSFLALEQPGEPSFYRLPEALPYALADQRLILNPGSVGQPRDGDPRASYVLYDDGDQSVTLHRVEYDIPKTQRKMTLAGLPQPLITRLALGQ